MYGAQASSLGSRFNRAYELSTQFRGEVASVPWCALPTGGAAGVDSESRTSSEALSVGELCVWPADETEFASGLRRNESD